MKVLWFSNTAANSVKYFKDSTFKGGWLQGLNKELETKVDLHIAFFNPKGPLVFKYGNTTYYSIIPGNWRNRLIYNSLFNINTEWDDSNLYIDIIEKVKPDIIDIRGTENGFISICGKTNIPINVDLQGVMSSIMKQYNAAFDDNILKSTFLNYGFNRVSLLPKSYFLAKKYLKRKAEREYKNLRYADYITGRTDYDRRAAKILAPNSEYYHNDRILKDDFYKYQWEKTSNKILQIHTTTSGGVYKGLETIYETAYELNRIGIRFKWNIAGIAPNDNILKIIKKQLKNKYNENDINLLGRLNPIELINTMLKSDIFVSASHIENSPNNVAEAMILGMPCIATFAGGTSSYIEDNKNGILIQDGDPFVLAGAIIELNEDKKKACVLGKNAREKAIKRHDKSKIINEILEIYNIIINKNRNIS